MESEQSTGLRELVEVLRERSKAEAEFQSRVLEEMRLLNRTLSMLQSRQTAGDL